MKVKNQLIKLKSRLRFTHAKNQTYLSKTDKTELAKLNSKKLSKGKHKVEIKSANKNYCICGKSIIKIK